MIKKFLKQLRIFLFRNYREKVLAKVLSVEILKLSEHKTNFKILDYGSGMQPEVILLLQSFLEKKNNINYIIECYDYYTIRDIDRLNKINKKIKFYNLKNFPLSNKYDYSLIIDVLHHIDMQNLKEHYNILKKISRFSDYIFIKDHFQHNFFSNIKLRLMDFIGNYYNDVFIPTKYLTIIEYNRLLKKLSFSEIKRMSDIRYYKRFWIFFSNPNLHFLSILKVKSND